MLRTRIISGYLSCYTGQSDWSVRDWPDPDLEPSEKPKRTKIPWSERIRLISGYLYTEKRSCEWPDLDPFVKPDPTKIPWIRICNLAHKNYLKISRAKSTIKITWLFIYVLKMSYSEILSIRYRGTYLYVTNVIIKQLIKLIMG